MICTTLGLDILFVDASKLMEFEIMIQFSLSIVSLWEYQEHQEVFETEIFHHNLMMYYFT